MTRRQMVLHLLREARPRGVTTGDLLQAGAGSRFGGRIFELRELGHVIETERVRDGEFRYTLTRDAELDAGPPDAQAPTGGALGMVSTPPAGIKLGATDPASEGTEWPAASDSAPPLSPPSGTPAASPPPTLFDANTTTRQRASYKDYDEEAA